ncbi:MAG TPA: sugar phosphate isomerase/epimerase [Verrucomicrobiae bacterium]|nr:sugar phosphate isomerase/epimerase [Verrucomicrobiae bacterium]
MNRRQFLATTTMAATASLLSAPELSARDRAGHGVEWPIGCFNRPWHEKKDWGLDTALDGIRDAGFKIVGLLRTGKGEPLCNSEATPEYLEQLKKRIASRGLRVNMSALRVKTALPLDEQIKDVRKQIDHSRIVGAEFGLTFGVDGPKYYENYYKLMKDAAAYGQEKGLKVVLKPHGGASGAAEEIMRCIRKVDHPNFKIWFDAGNIIYYTGKDPVEQLKPIVQYVTGFCAKDCDHQKGSVNLEFGTGKVDFHAVFSELKRGGFNGPVMDECVALSSSPEEATENARKNRVYLEKLFASL